MNCCVRLILAPRQATGPAVYLTIGVIERRYRFHDVVVYV